MDGDETSSRALVQRDEEKKMFFFIFRIWMDRRNLIELKRVYDLQNWDLDLPRKKKKTDDNSEENYRIERERERENVKEETK